MKIYYTFVPYLMVDCSNTQPHIYAIRRIPFVFVMFRGKLYPRAFSYSISKTNCNTVTLRFSIEPEFHMFSVHFLVQETVVAANDTSRSGSDGQ